MTNIESLERLDKDDLKIYPLAFYKDMHPDVRIYALYFKPNHAIFYKISDTTGELSEFVHNVSEIVDPNAWLSNPRISEGEFWSNIL